MKWEYIQDKFPNSWVLIETFESDVTVGESAINMITVLNDYETSKEAMLAYRTEHKKNPNRELYVYHTQNKNFQFKERIWLGVRSR